jgi:uncharacterized protein (DUF2141 family)
MNLHMKERQMKQTLILGPTLVIAMAGAVAAGEVSLTVTGFSEDTGMARIVLMAGEAGYHGEMPVARIASVPIENGRAIWDADDIPPGRYAIIAHHDRDNDDALNRPVLGLPQEPYGYTNGAWTSFGLPDWEAVAFEVGDVPVRQGIHLRMNAFAAASQMMMVGLPALVAVFGGLALFGRFRRSRPASRT